MLLEGALNESHIVWSDKELTVLHREQSFMKIILLRLTKNNAFFMVKSGKDSQLKNLIVPNDETLVTGLSEKVFGRTNYHNEDDIYEYFIIYKIEQPVMIENKYDDGRIVKIIKKIPICEFKGQIGKYEEGVNMWTPPLKELRKGWMTPFE
jgi:hypothetical protein